MTQKEYSDYILDGLLNQFPEFDECVSFQNDIATIQIFSKLRMLNFWITTQDSELTIGFEGNDPKWDWHTHMSLFNAYEPDDEIRVASKLIQDILTDKESIICSNKKGYSLVDSIDELMKEKDNDETIDIKKWSEL
jgi:hypothetical protein